MLYDELTAALGYKDSSLFGEGESEPLTAPHDRHWIQTARKAGVRGTYFFRTSPEPQALRPAVHVAEAQTRDEARAIHRHLWNQGINPFLIVVLPFEVRVFSGFAYHPTQPHVGEITSVPVDSGTVAQVAHALSSFHAESINRGEIWRTHAQHLGSDKRVDTTLLANLEALSEILQSKHELTDTTSHALIGKFVYLSYLRARDILSDRWLVDEAGLEPSAVFVRDAFSPAITLQGFRKLAKAVEARFNGRIFPIAWGSARAPRADAIQSVARVFAGEEVPSGQLHLPFSAYDFSFIPVEFLSSIYEQFLHVESAERADDDPDEVSTDDDEASNPEKRGAHYTPEPLADYLVSEVETVRALRPGMRVLDPCCGSGVFLVVAFRRLVELECARQKRALLNASELKELLEASIYGVERNRTACQIAGFSLILALLTFVDPPELHRRRNFKFPSLVGRNLFPEDFFNESGEFWQRVRRATNGGLKFDWIVGNPPWVELDADDPKARPVLDWSKKHERQFGLARARTGEAFAWRVMECLADHGAIGLLLHAKSLTNDHLADWRKKFFDGTRVCRLTNFANLAYVIFASAQQPAVSIIYTRKNSGDGTEPILHYGPFVANQCMLVPRSGTKRKAWAIGFSESEIKNVSAADARRGDAATWKFALWGNQRDAVAIRRLQNVFPKKLGDVAESRGWHLGLGLQLRADAGTKNDPNEYVSQLEGLKVLDHKAFVRAGSKLRITPEFLEENSYGLFVREGRLAGLKLTTGPRLFLWNDFAAYTDRQFIFRHDKLGLAGGTASEMKAVSAVWNSSYVGYLLFFVTSAAWGIGYSQVDKGDAARLPFPDLTPDREEKLCAAWDAASALETNDAEFRDVKMFLDESVAAVLDLPASVSLVVREFFEVRYELNKGKTPPLLAAAPDEPEMLKYARRLRQELDAFVGGKAHHRITVLHSKFGCTVSIAVTKEREQIQPEVRAAAGDERAKLCALLESAESRFSQWVYVKRSVRIFEGNTVHIIKPPRRLEWTETQALLDADDIIAEAIETQSTRTA